MSSSTMKMKESKEKQHDLVCETGGEAERVSRIPSGAEGDALCAARSGAQSWRGRKGTGCAKPSGARESIREQ